MNRAVVALIAVAALLVGFALAQQPAEPPAPASPAQPQTTPAWTAPIPAPEVAFDAAVWGMPIVSMQAMRQAFFRDAGAQYGDIVYWSRPADWKNQTKTPDASSRYVYFNFNTKDGPLVLELPPSTGAGLFGSVLDAWQVPRADVGANGDDKGLGGKYLLLPPDYPDPPPQGYRPVRFDTHNGYALLRVIPQDASPEAEQRALALIRQLRLYPLAEAAVPPAQKYIDMAGKLFDGTVRFDRHFYAALAQMVSEEPALPRDAEMLANLITLGIVAGQPFSPNEASAQLLTAAAQEVRADFMRRAAGDGEPYFPGQHWRTPSVVGARTGFTYEVNGELDIGARGLAYFLAYAPQKKPGETALSLTAFADRAGRPLTGEINYRLRVPAEVPAARFWSVAVYNLETAAFFREAPTINLDSYNQKLQQNADGSVDIFFGTMPPAGNETNWIYTTPRRGWFAIFRFHGPEQPLLAKSWVLPDIEQVNLRSGQGETSP